VEGGGKKGCSHHRQSSKTKSMGDTKKRRRTEQEASLNTKKEVSRKRGRLTCHVFGLDCPGSDGEGAPKRVSKPNTAIKITTETVKTVEKQARAMRTNRESWF